MHRKASHLLSGMTPVHKYGPGTPLFNGVALTGAPTPLPGLSYSVTVWYDAPATVAVNTLPFLSHLLLPLAAAVAGDNLPLVTVMAANVPLPTLVDSGASHDFVSEAIVQQLGLTPRSSDWSHVTLADGGKQALLGQVTLRVSVGPLRLTLQPYVLPALTDVASLILGSGTLERHAACLQFGQRVLILSKGPATYSVPFSAPAPGGANAVPAAPPAVNFAVAALCQKSVPVAVGRKAAARLLRKGVHAVLVRPKLYLNAAVPPSDAKDPDVEALLEANADLFREIPGLPPVRPVDHTIPLMPGAQPVSRPMYRLSPSELDEVKRQVTDLLNKGMIRPSTSPYSAPILFVGKTDGGLRMCIDYRGLIL